MNANPVPIRLTSSRVFDGVLEVVLVSPPFVQDRKCERVANGLLTNRVFHQDSLDGSRSRNSRSQALRLASQSNKIVTGTNQ